MHHGFEPFIPYIEYFSFIVVLFLSVFWRPITGIFFLLPMIPLQTIRYRVNDFPLGESLFGLTVLCIALGLLRSGRPVLPKTSWTKLLCIYGVYTFISLCLGSLYLGRSLPIPTTARLGVWHDYMVMPALLLLTAAVAPTSRQMKAMVVVMCLATFVVDHNFWNAISGRDFSSYSDDMRMASSMGYAGSNGWAAFGAQAAAFLLALAAFERKFSMRMAYWALATFTAVCVMLTFSRGGYLALIVGCVFVGLVKQRTLLVLLLLFFWAGTGLVPGAVRERVSMTYDSQSGELDHSAETRVTLWEDTMEVFRINPVIGTGFNTYAYMHRVNNYEDTHNYYLKVLVETGIIGLGIFAWFVSTTFRSGYLLFRQARDPFLASLGLGLAAWVVCCCVANCFGDRWSFLQVNGYMWILGGMVAQAWSLEQESTSAVLEAEEEASDAGEIEALAEQA